MARIRDIKPEFFMDEDLAGVSLTARLCFIGLWTLADKAGRLEDRPLRIRAQVFPYDAVDVGQLLEELAGQRFILRYTVGGRGYIEIRSFRKHQRPHPKEQDSVIPGPDQDGAPPSATYTIPPSREISRQAVEGADPAAAGEDLSTASPHLSGSCRSGSSGSSGSGISGSSACGSGDLGPRARDPSAGLVVTPAGMVRLERPPPPARARWRSAFDWCFTFGQAWADRYDRMSYGDPGDPKAQGKLQDLLDAMPDEEIEPLWDRREEFFQRYLSSNDPKLLAVRHNFGFFVGRWTDFRPDLSRGRAPAKRAGIRRVCEWHMDAADNTGVPAPKSDPVCVECQALAPPVPASRAPPRAAAAPQPIRDAAGR